MAASRASLLALTTAAARELQGDAPPRGWSSWIAYQHTVNQAKMEAAMDAIHKLRPLGPGGKLVSLQNLGYSDVGLDGGWARCEGVPAGTGRTYHDEQGNLLINETLFPSFGDMTEHAHSLGQTASWYLNCDQCGADGNNITESDFTESWYRKDAEQAARFKFDGVKFDTQPAGPNWNISKWSEALNATGRPMVIQDCLDKHPDGAALPKSDHPSIDILHNPEYCPFAYYRTGGDNFPSFLRGMKNTLIESEPFLNVRSPVPASRPGCWAFPDLLSIGESVMREVFHEKHPDCPLYMNDREEQTLFATWAIVSSPLILSFDVTNDTEVERLWPIIANEQALSINSQWAGEAGHVLKRSAENLTAGKECGKEETYPSWVVWSKRLSDPSSSVAVLAINIADTPQAFSVTYGDLVEAGAGGGSTLIGTDVWTGQPVAKVKHGAAWHVDLPDAHGSRFLVFSPAEEHVV